MHRTPCRLVTLSVRCVLQAGREGRGFYDAADVRGNVL